MSTETLRCNGSPRHSDFNPKHSIERNVSYTEKMASTPRQNANIKESKERA